MAQQIPNLWSEKDIKVEVLSPLAILHTQATNLEQMTKGLLQAEITQVVGEKDTTFYRLDIVAPALGGYRHSLFAISHQKEMVYPVKFVLSDGRLMPLYTRLDGSGEIAETEAEFLEKLKAVLRSSSVNAVIQSIIARSNEVLTAHREAATEAVA